MNYSHYSTQTINTFMYKVYGWMFGAVGISGIVAYFCASNQDIYTVLMGSQWAFFLIMIAQFAAVIALSFFLPRLSFFAAAILFLLYSVLTGVMLSSIFLLYTASSIAATLLVAAGMFGIMALYGYLTKSDLSGMGNLLLMGLLGMILALLVNIFLQNNVLDFIIACAGVTIFTLLTAYDVQKIKQLSQQAMHEKEEAEKFALLGALTLYLDLINLFLSLLRFTGKRRSN